MNQRRRPSELISFRLNERDANFPDDAKALEVYRKWTRAGKDARTIMTSALLALGGYPITADPPNVMSRQLSTLVQQLQQAIRELGNPIARGAYAEGDRAGDGADLQGINSILDSLAHAVRADDDDDD